MKLTGYLIEKYNNMGSAYSCRRLLDEAQKQGVDLRILGVSDTSIKENNCYNQGYQLENKNFIINRYKYGKVKDYLNGLGAKSYNSLQALNIYINKLEQLKNINSAYFIKPKYIAGYSSLPFGMLADELKLPFVAKGLESSMGQEIFLIKNKEEYKNLANLYPAFKEWLFEEFIFSSSGRDMRIYCARGEVIAAMERTSDTDFRANVALGANVKKIKIEPYFQNIAHDIYKQTGLDFVGLDLLYGKELPYFCEINVTAGLERIEQATDINVAGAIMQTIKDDFNAE